MSGQELRNREHRAQIMREQRSRPLMASVATFVLRAGQRLRADETASATTFTLRYAAARQAGAR